MIKKLSLISLVTASALFAGDVRLTVSQQYGKGPKNDSDLKKALIDTKSSGVTDAKISVNHYYDKIALKGSIGIYNGKDDGNDKLNGLQLNGLVGYQIDLNNDIYLRLFPLGYSYETIKTKDAEQFVDDKGTVNARNPRVNVHTFKVGAEVSKDVGNVTLNVGYYPGYAFKINQTARVAAETPVVGTVDIGRVTFDKPKKRLTHDVKLGADYKFENNVILGAELGYRYGGLFKGGNFGVSVGYKYN